MKRIGEYWVPDSDVTEGYNLERTKAAYENGDGIQIDHLREALKHIPGTDVAIDGGANVGSWSRLLASRFEKVHAFEPFPEAFECLQRNVEEWNLNDKVHLHAAALANNTEGVAVSPAAAGRRTVTCSITGKGNTPATTIDLLELSDCDFIKLDIEGYEDKAIEGGLNTIKKYSPWIMIENRREGSGWFQRKTRAERALARLGYVVVEKFGDDELDWLFRRQ